MGFCNSSNPSAIQVLGPVSHVGFITYDTWTNIRERPGADGFQSWNIVVVYQTPSFKNKYDNHATNPNK